MKQQLLEKYNELLEKYEEISKDRDILKDKAESPNKRIYNIPPELGNSFIIKCLALSSLSGYSSIVDQLIECLIAMKLKDREITRSKAFLEQSKVLSAMHIIFQRNLPGFLLEISNIFSIKIRNLKNRLTNHKPLRKRIFQRLKRSGTEHS